MFQNVFFPSNPKINKKYYIIDDRLKEINAANDLGVEFQSNFLFSSYIGQTFLKALRSFGFLI